MIRLCVRVGLWTCKWIMDLHAQAVFHRAAEVLINQNEFHLLNEEWRVFCEVWMSQNNFIVYKLFGPLAKQGQIYGHFGKCANVKLSFHSQALSNLLSVLSVWERESCDQIFMLQRIHAWSTVFFLSWNTLFSLR